MVLSTHDAAARLGVAAWEVLQVAPVDGQWHALVHDSADHTDAWRPLGLPADDEPAVDVDGDGVPDGTAAQILAWVGDDPQRAAAALMAEQGRDKPRTTLVAALGKLAG